MLRYFRRLQLKDLALDRSMIPLGSCTMKLNASTEMIPITWPGFSDIHPFAPVNQAQGYKKLFDDLEAWLAEITGFDAISGSIVSIDIHGRDGVAIRDKWAEGPQSYLGLMTEGFPNLFTITGPGSPSVLSNVLRSIEQHVDFISECITSMRDAGQSVIESTAEADQSWMVHVDDIATRSVYKSCNSWYLGSNIPGKPRVFTTYIGWPQYDVELGEVVEGDYRGFVFSKAGEEDAASAG